MIIGILSLAVVIIDRRWTAEQKDVLNCQECHSYSSSLLG